MNNYIFNTKLSVNECKQKLAEFEGLFIRSDVMGENFVFRMDQSRSPIVPKIRGRLIKIEDGTEVIAEFDGKIDTAFYIFLSALLLVAIGSAIIQPTVLASTEIITFAIIFGVFGGFLFYMYKKSGNREYLSKALKDCLQIKA